MPRSSVLGPLFAPRRIADAGPAATRSPRLPRRIAHLDLDTFFVAVERARNPELRGVPVLVGHPGRRGVVASASYESRAFGCRSAQPMVQALRLCPDAVVVPPSFEAYRDVSARFHRILREVAPVVESAGLDEAYADLTGLGTDGRAGRAVMEGFRARVHEELDIAVSVCIAGTKSTAKVGSDRAKPDGLIEVPPGEDAAFLAPLPIRELPLVGPKMQSALHAAGIHTIGQAAAADPRWLAIQFGRAGEMLTERARGIDPTPVHGGEHRQRQISREVTFGENVHDLDVLRRVIARHAERIGADLRQANRRARTVTLKVRWSDFSTLARSQTLERPFQASHVIRDAGIALLDEVVRSEGLHPVRLLGVSASNLVEDAVQLDLEDALQGGAMLRTEQLDRALDGIRERFGSGAVARGANPLAHDRA